MPWSTQGPQGEIVSGFGYEDVAKQAWMLLDQSRDAYIDALKEVIRPDSVVLDIGSGSGVWALFAARFGARKVYAVERSAMAEVIVEMADANGHSDVIEVLHLDARDLPALDPAPNVVVSEMLGHFAPDEDQHHLYRLAQRHAQDDAVFIPSSYTVELALADAADFKWEVERLQNYRGIHMEPLVRRLFNRTHLAAHDPSMLLSNEASTSTLASTAARPERYSCTVQAHKSGVANAIVASFTAQLSPTVRLRTNVTQPKTHWQQTVFPLSPPLAVEAGDDVELTIFPRAVNNRDTYAWSATRGDVTVGGDAMKALLGGKSAMLAALGFVLRQPTLQHSKTLQHWQTALGSGANSIDDMATAVFSAHPDDFTELSEARDAVLNLLHKCDGLSLH